MMAMVMVFYINRLCQWMVRHRHPLHGDDFCGVCCRILVVVLFLVLHTNLVYYVVEKSSDDAFCSRCLWWVCLGFLWFLQMARGMGLGMGIGDGDGDGDGDEDGDVIVWRSPL